MSYNAEIQPGSEVIYNGQKAKVLYANVSYITISYWGKTYTVKNDDSLFNYSVSDSGKTSDPIKNMINRTNEDIAKRKIEMTKIDGCLSELRDEITKIRRERISLLDGKLPKYLSASNKELYDEMTNKLYALNSEKISKSSWFQHLALRNFDDILCLHKFSIFGK